MKLNMIEISEKAASQYALEFLRGYAGNEVFLGSEIEQILAEKAAVIYQAVDDSEYYGAAIHLLEQHLIAINTMQPLRTRYYSAAHELWHLQYESKEIPVAEIPDFDHERAADHFAAALMLPERLILSLMQNLKENLEILVIKIADISSMPYVAVVRRLQELGKRFPREVSSRTELEWIENRETLGISPSVLDKADVFTQFTALSNEVANQLAEGEITLELAANLLKHVAPEKAEFYWEERQKITDDWVDDD